MDAMPNYCFSNVVYTVSVSINVSSQMAVLFTYIQTAHLIHTHKISNVLEKCLILNSKCPIVLASSDLSFQ